MPIIAELRTVDGRSLGVILLQDKTFRSGSVGYFGLGKLEIDGERYQIQAQAVKIGSKSQEPSPE